jgi:hypothetical protein
VNPELCQTLPDFVEPERLDDGNNKLHWSVVSFCRPAWLGEL